MAKQGTNPEIGTMIVIIVTTEQQLEDWRDFKDYCHKKGTVIRPAAGRLFWPRLNKYVALLKKKGEIK